MTKLHATAGVAARVVALILLSAPLSAQIAISGRVRDSTLQPSRRTIVCSSGPATSPYRSHVCAPVDSSGNYHMVVAPFLPLLVSVSCETTKLFSKQVAVDTVTTNEPTVVRDWIIGTTRCDTRPIQRLRATFRGSYSFGFEVSAFIACAGDPWINDTTARRGAWLEFAEDATRSIRSTDIPADSGYSRAYVELHGTLVGPGRYGHMSSSGYELTADRVFVMRAPSPNDCR